MPTPIAFTVNGSSQRVTTDPERTLLDVLREDLELTGTKYGCGEGSCRSCTALVDGRPVATCQTPIGDVAGKEVVTIEGVAPEGQLHPVQDAFIAELAMQCGFCVPGMVMTAIALLDNNPSPTRAQIVEWMNGNICRCCNYPNIIRAVERAARQRQGATAK